VCIGAAAALFAGTVLCWPARMMTAQDPTFSARAELVRVDVLVTANGQPVRGLQREDFEVLDNGVLQDADLVAFEDAPLNVVLALDMSRSVRGAKLVQLRAAARMVIGSLAERDKAAVLSFASTVFSRVPLTPDAARLIGALNALPDAGDTAVVDASYAAILLSETDVGRPLVVVFSDGVDTASFLTAPAVLETARRSDAVVYAVSTSAAPAGSFLDELCARTGGRLIDAASTEDFRQTFLGLLEEFRHRYLLSYTPTGVGQSGWHELEVRVKAPRATVRARPGYFRGDV
jgi:VWFA-related protein